MDEQLHRVLYVEDEPDIQAVARFALEQLGGFEVEVCSSGTEALDRIGVFKPHVVLLDVMIPGMDGPATLQALRGMPAGRTVPVIFMTAKAQPQEIADYKGLGAIGVIPKPFDPITLGDEVRKIWNLARARTGDLESRLAEIRRGYIAELPAKAVALEAAWRCVEAQAWQPEAVEELQRMAHNLAGSGATFGFTALSRSARALEIPIRDLTQADTTESVGARSRIPDLVAEVLAELRHAARDASPG